MVRYQNGVADDEELADEWEAVVQGRSISHEEHLRIARILIRRHGRDEATQRLVVGTRANCEAMAARDRFDENLTLQWSAEIADALEHGDGETFEDFIGLHPRLSRSDLLGLPAWRIEDLRGE